MTIRALLAIVALAALTAWAEPVRGLAPAYADQSDSKLSKAPAPPSEPQVAIEPPGEPSPEILKACRRINPESLLRVRGDCGQFQGYASQIGPQGLDGLRADPTDGSFASPTGLVTWNRIDRIENRVGSSGWGALVGAVMLGGIGAYVGAVLEPSGDPEVSGTAIGVALGGAVGAGLGALIGAAIPRWHLAYETVRLPGVTPTITAITPLNQTVSAGSSAAITVTARGTEPLAYRWFRNGLPLAERKNPIIAFTPSQTSDSGAYFCVVTNGFGTVTSAVAILSVTAPAE